MINKYRSGLLLVALITLLFPGCTPSRVNWDKAAMMEIKKVAVVLYTVPVTINYYDDPRKKEKSLLQDLAAVANVNNGPQAASKALIGFTKEDSHSRYG